MNIKFDEATFEKLIFLANQDGKSVAAFVAQKMQELTGQLVNVQYSMNILPTGTNQVTRPLGEQGLLGERSELGFQTSCN